MRGDWEEEVGARKRCEARGTRLANEWRKGKSADAKDGMSAGIREIEFGKLPHMPVVNCQSLCEYAFERQCVEIESVNLHQQWEG